MGQVPYDDTSKGELKVAIEVFDVSRTPALIYVGRLVFRGGRGKLNARIEHEK